MFLDRLSPIYENEREEWNEVKLELKNEFNNFLWYPSSGLDFRPMVFLNQKDTELYQTPTIDIFFMSDYSKKVYKQIKKIYKKFIDGYLLFKDCRIKIEITQIIPLNYFNKKEKKDINQKYPDNFHSSMTNKVVKNIDFFYLKIEIESNYFEEEYFHCFFSPMENWTLLNEVFKKNNIKFDYIWGVRDGTRKGGAYRAVNIDNEIVSTMKNKKYWIYDYIETDKDKYNMRIIDTIKVDGYGYSDKIKIVEIAQENNKNLNKEE